MSVTPNRPSTTHRLVVDVEGARDIGPSEAAGLVRECLALAHKQYDNALWRALMELESPPAGSDGAPATRDADEEPLPAKIARIVRRDQNKVAPKFRAEFDRLFQDRRDGKPRKRDVRGNEAPTLALVGESDHTGQVSLKNAVQGMKTAVREGGFGFDLRVRRVMREEAQTDEYDNPWGATLLCDALGNTCRGLWGAEGVWRPIMEHLVRALTPVLLAVQQEIDQLLQDRDVLPVLKVRTRKRAPDGTAPMEPADLFSRLAQTYPDAAAPGPAPAAAAPPGMAPYPSPAVPGAAYAAPPAAAWPQPGFQPQGAAPAGGDALDFGNAGGWHVGAPAMPGMPAAPATVRADSAWHVLERALNLLQQVSVPGSGVAANAPAGGFAYPAGSGAAAALPAFDPAALAESERNVLPIVEAAIAAGGDTPLPRAIVDVVSQALDEVFENPYLASPVKLVFGRLQIPILKAALKDREVLADPRHPARRFFDTLAAAAVGVRPEVAHDALFLELAGHLATTVRDAPDDQEPFAQARDELEHFLDAERAAYNQKLAQALPALVALDAQEEARGRARTAVAVHAGGRTIPPEVRDFLDRDVVDRLAQAWVEGGQDAPAARQTLDFVDELLWSIAPDRGPAARKRLLPLIPRLVRTIGEWWPQDENNRARRKVFLARLYTLHVEALQATTDLPPPDDEAHGSPSRPRPTIPDAPPLAERDEAADTMESLMRGDWVAFTDEQDGSTLLAKYAWRSPHGTQMLFTHRDGSIALIHTPASLAKAFRDGKAKVAIEAVPLFERAMEKLLEARG